MRSVQEWLDAYAVSHQHPANKLIHWLCVPIITFSVLGLAWAAAPWLAVVLAVAAIAYYARLSPRLAAGMAAVAGIILAVLAPLGNTFWLSVGLFVGAWVAQFWGHRIEGRKPSFLEDVQFLLIGPLWLLGAIYRRCGWRL